MLVAGDAAPLDSELLQAERRVAQSADKMKASLGGIDQMFVSIADSAGKMTTSITAGFDKITTVSGKLREEQGLVASAYDRTAAAAKAAGDAGVRAGEEATAGARDAAVAQKDVQAQYERTGAAARASADAQARGSAAVAASSANAGRAAENAAKRSELAFGASSSSMTKWGGRIALGLAAGVAGAETLAVKFQGLTTLLNTQAGASVKHVEQLSSGMLKMSYEVGQTPNHLAEAMYHVVSAMNKVLPPTQQVSKELEVLHAAAQGAAIGHSNLDETTYALSSAMMSLGAANHHASEMMGSLNAIVGVGDMRMQEFVTSLRSGVIPSATNFGVSLNSMGAALAYLTDRGMPAVVAATRLRMAMTMMGAPTKQAAAQLEAIGMSAGQVHAATTAMSEALTKSGVRVTTLAHDMRQPDGIQVALTDLMDHLKSAGLNAEASGALIARAFGGARSGSAVMTLIQHTDQLKQTFEAVNKQQHAFGHDWGQTQKTLQFQFKQLVAGAESLGVTIGTMLIPPTEKLIGDLKSTAEWFGHNHAALRALEIAVGAFAAVTIGSYFTSKIKTAIEMMKEFGTVAAATGRWMMGGPRTSQGPAAAGAATSAGTVGAATKAETMFGIGGARSGFGLPGSMANPIITAVMDGQTAGLGSNAAGVGRSVERTAEGETVSQGGVILPAGVRAAEAGSGDVAAGADIGGAVAGSGILAALKGGLPKILGTLGRGLGIAGIGALGAQAAGSIVGGKTGGIISGVGQGAAAGAGIGTMIEPGVGTAIGAGVGAAGGALLSVPGLTGGIGKALSAVSDEIKHLFGPELKEVGRAASELFGSIGKEAGKLGPVFSKFSKVAGEAFHIFLSVASTVFKALFAVFDTVFIKTHFIQNIFESVFSGIVGIIKGWLKIMTGAFDIIDGIFTGDWSKLWKGVKEVFSGAWDAIIGNLKIIGAPFIAAFKSFIEPAAHIFVTFVEDIVGEATKLPGELVKLVKEAATGLGSLATTFFNDAWKLGQQVLTGLVKGITSLPGDLVKAAKGLGETVLSEAGNFLGIKSPSKQMEKMGQSVVEGFIHGIMHAKLEQGIKTVFTDALESELGRLKSEFTQFERASKVFGEGVGHTFANMATTTGEGLEEMMTNVNAAYKALGAKQQVKFSLVKGKSGGGTKKGFAVGGYIGQQGMAGPDDQVITAAKGEAVLNRHQIPYVQMGLKAIGMQGGLPELFGRVTTPHAAPAKFAKGGPVGGPAELAAMMAEANKINAEHLPYAWGGGHGTAGVPSVGSASSSGGPPQLGYDCSGSVSAVLHAGGLLARPEVSGELMHWGLPGPGAVTVYANPIHTFMSIDGRFFGTHGADGAGWYAGSALPGFVQRHAPGIGPGAGIGEMVGTPTVAGGPAALNQIANAAMKGVGKSANEALQKLISEAGGKGGGGDWGTMPHGNIMKIAEFASKADGVPWEPNLVRTLLSKESSGGQNLAPHNFGGGLDPAGPFQVISSTFNSYAKPGHHNRMNPVDNALAAFAYIKSRYGTMSGLAKATGLLGSGYKGYAAGGQVGGVGPHGSPAHQAAISRSKQHLSKGKGKNKSAGHRSKPNTSVRALTSPFATYPDVEHLPEVASGLENQLAILDQQYSLLGQIEQDPHGAFIMQEDMPYLTPTFPPNLQVGWDTMRAKKLNEEAIAGAGEATPEMTLQGQLLDWITAQDSHHLLTGPDIGILGSTIIDGEPLHAGMNILQGEYLNRQFEEGLYKTEVATFTKAIKRIGEAITERENRKSLVELVISRALSRKKKIEKQLERLAIVAAHRRIKKAHAKLSASEMKSMRDELIFDAETHKEAVSEAIMFEKQKPSKQQDKALLHSLQDESSHISKDIHDLRSPSTSVSSSRESVTSAYEHLLDTQLKQSLKPINTELSTLGGSTTRIGTGGEIGKIIKDMHGLSAGASKFDAAILQINTQNLPSLALDFRNIQDASEVPIAPTLPKAVGAGGESEKESLLKPALEEKLRLVEQENLVLKAQSPVFKEMVGSFAVGTTFVPRTGQALVHEGEAIIPRSLNPFVGGSGSIGVGSTPEIHLHGDLADFTTRVESVVDGKKRDITTYVNKHLARDAQSKRLLPV